MASFYLFLIIVLFILAISDLLVGVSNDAVNFLNSAVGAKAATFKTIMFVAALGVLVGCTFSSGMMEVARKGIFHPEYFYFSEIIVIFLAVMVTDVILLDTFNTFGMPTSTTVSIVFELLGAAVAVSLIKIFNDPNALHLYEYINSAKALAIISGILLSVVIAFSCGVIAQYLSRLLFSFDYEKNMKRYGAIWVGLGVSAITYFMLIKGSKGASFMTSDMMAFIKENTWRIMAFSFIGWTFLLYILGNFFRVDILKVLVLIGTFALAMAFAGNDLVNFIGVPLAGYNSYQIYLETGGNTDFLMDGLAGKVPTPTILLLLSGVIMAVTLYTSKKARSVIKTSLDLGRQDEGYERFSSFILSRKLVRNFATATSFINNKLPNNFKSSVTKRFDERPFIERQQALGAEAPAFDMIRASVTLVIASILIAIGTNLKLPLSTTYVTFMVFMGTSLADGSWGRESAVYRVSGVLSVIGGWFFTALSAFLVAFVCALIFHFGGMIAIILMILVAGFVVYRSHRYHGERVAEQNEFEKGFSEEELNSDALIEYSTKELKKYLNQFHAQVDISLKGLRDENLTLTSRAHQDFRRIMDKISRLKMKSSRVLDQVADSDLESGHMYILVIDYLFEMGEHALDVIEANHMHVDNNHKPLLPEQLEELLSLHQMISERYQWIIDLFESKDQAIADKLNSHVDALVHLTRNVRKKQIKRIKNHEVGTRNSALFLGHLAELRNLGLFSNRIVRVFEELVIDSEDDSESSEN